jgi:hypothetical protein
VLELLVACFRVEPEHLGDSEWSSVFGGEVLRWNLLPILKFVVAELIFLQFLDVNVPSLLKVSDRIEYVLFKVYVLNFFSSLELAKLRLILHNGSIGHSEFLYFVNMLLLFAN